MPDREELIRKRAHQIWEDEGRPEGQEASHWQRATGEIDSLAEAGSTDSAADLRRSDPVPEPPPLNTTREAAALTLARSAPSGRK